MKRDREQPAFGRRLMELRQRIYYTQGRLAKAAGMSSRVVECLEQGTRKDPRLSTVVRLARALGVSVVDLIVDEASP